MAMYLTPGHFSLPPEAERMAKRALDMFQRNPDLTAIISDGQAALQEIRSRQGHHSGGGALNPAVTSGGWSFLGVWLSLSFLNYTKNMSRLYL
jgi:hypothetical protein